MTQINKNIQNHRNKFKMFDSTQNNNATFTYYYELMHS